MPSSPSLLLSSLELKHRIDALHSELGLPTSIDVINTVPCRHTAGQPDLDSPLPPALRPFSGISSLGCTMFTVQTEHHIPFGEPAV